MWSIEGVLSDGSDRSDFFLAPVAPSNLQTHDAFATRIRGAAPKLFAAIFSAFGRAENRRFAALWALRDRFRSV